ncbi:MAG TPA: nitrate reductase molybdenum cofactor assembly chaperone [Jatrophihabitantaceae bacterium]|nr:nitrate reductase molybdenum cofactor assembly chaperone [Jatrophihabitantaceae bacterium]
MTAERDRTRALQSASLCLDYPDQALVNTAPVIAEAAAELPPPAGAPLARFVAHLTGTPLSQLTRDYVDTFDLRRRCCLYLTYYSHGDTRKRGMALLRFTHAYRRAGLELTGGELADHLGIVCAVAARAPETGLALLRDHRAAVELLAAALHDTASPYADVLDTIRAVLPEPAPDDLERALQLAAEGPPSEEVGLEPFAPPEYMGSHPAKTLRVFAGTPKVDR